MGIGFLECGGSSYRLPPLVHTEVVRESEESGSRRRPFSLLPFDICPLSFDLLLRR